LKTGQEKTEVPAGRAKAVAAGIVLTAAAVTGGALLLAAPIFIAAGASHELVLEKNLPLMVSAVALLCVFVLINALAFYLLHRIAALREEKAEMARLALVTEKTDQAVFLTNAEGVIEWINEGFTRVAGHSRAEAIGKQPAPLLLGPLQNLNFTQKIRENIAGQRLINLEMLCSHRRGHRYWLSLTMTPLFNEQKQLTNFVGVGMDITARKRAEEEVARIGRRSELLLNAAGDGIFGIDLQGAITFVNQAAARLTGWPAGELAGRPVTTVLHQLRVDRSRAAQDDLFTGAAFVDGTVQIGDADEFKARDGTVFPVEYTSTPVHENNNALGSVVVFRNITDRRQSEALRSRQARQAALRAEVAFALAGGNSLRDFLQTSMQSLVKHLDGAFARVWTVDAEGKMLELRASAGIYTHLDGQHGRIPIGTFKVGKIAKERMPAFSHNLVTDPDIIDKDWVVRERMASFIGFPLFVERRLIGVMAMFSRNKLPDDAMEMLGSISDALAQGIVRKQTEETVAEQAALLDKSQDAIVAIDLNRRCTYWNKSAERLYGWEEREVFGQNLEQLTACDRAYLERAMAVTLHDGEWHDNEWALRRGNEMLTVESRWTVVTDVNGKPRSILIVNTDVTERKRIEAQFLRTQRMESIGTLAGGIAHDLNNVLSPIVMSVEILKNKVKDEQGQRMLTILETNARRGADMVKQVLSFARGVEGERVLLQSKHLIQDVAKFIAETFPKTIQFKCNLPETLWPLVGDTTQLHQVLVNLAVNARDAMLEGGTLTISAENHILESEVEQQGVPILPGFFVLLRVSDTGTGIPPEILNKIFDPFFTTKAPGKGTGLGLSTVLGIIKSHGGFLQVESKVNQGTTFLVHLPAKEAAQPTAHESASSQLPTGHGELILAVDDEAAVLTMTKETLETFGYRVLTARDGTEAVALFNAHQFEVRGVLTDMLMPNMDGPATIRILKRIDPAIKIIAASGMMDGEKVKDATGLNHVAFLMKPFTVEKLLTTVHEVLSDAA
jgi:PAS domain S-box-containing protein